jgi:hypothetical protein
MWISFCAPLKEDVRRESAKRPLSVRSLPTCKKTRSKTGSLKSRGRAELQNRAVKLVHPRIHQRIDE